MLYRNEQAKGSSLSVVAGNPTTVIISLRYNILELMFDTVNMDLGYAFKDYVEEAYFWPFEIGNFQGGHP